MRLAFGPSNSNFYYDAWECGDDRLKLLSSAKDSLTKTPYRVLLLMKGTLFGSSSSTTTKHYYETRSRTKRRKAVLAASPSPLRILNGQSGILELIGQYAGYPTAKEKHTLRQLVDLLSAFIKDTPFR